MDKKDVIAFFQELRYHYKHVLEIFKYNENIVYIENLFEGYDISEIRYKAYVSFFRQKCEKRCNY